jgi:hypothetical protein
MTCTARSTSCQGLRCQYAISRSFQLHKVYLRSHLLRTPYLKLEALPCYIGHRHFPAISPSLMHPSNRLVTGTTNSSATGPQGKLRCKYKVCIRTGCKLPKCSGRGVVQYCSEEHQIEDWHEHKTAVYLHEETSDKTCQGIARCSQCKGRFHVGLHASDPGRNWHLASTPADAFETQVGNFCGIINTRPYMCTRFDLANESAKSEPLTVSRKDLIT